MKRKLFLVAMMIVLCTMLITIFATTASAEEDAITVTYNHYSGSVRETATPNADGSFTLRSTKISNNSTVTLNDGTSVDKTFYGWFDEESNLYNPGEKVTFTKSTRLYEAYGVTVNNADDLYKVLSQGAYVKLGANITTDKNLGSGWKTIVINLNGYNLTSTVDDNAFSIDRGAFIMHGKGTFTHSPATQIKDDRGFVRFQAHGYADESNPQLFWIGKDVKIETPYHLLYVKSIKAGYNMPDMVIAGDVTANSLARINPAITNARCYIANNAKINLSTSFLDFRNQTATDVYMNVTLGGDITLGNTSALVLTDFMMTNRFNILEVNNGSFTVSSTDAERIAMFLPETLMLKPTANDDGTTIYNVTVADCVHDWVLDTESSVQAVPGEAGIDIFECSKCGTGKQTITVYSPQNTEISVTVKTEEGTEKYTVLAGEVLDFQYNGIGASALCYIAALKDTANFTADQIVAFDIPAGVLEFFGFENSTVEIVNIIDGADVKVYSLTAMTALKTINVGAATVAFENLASSTIEKISSSTAGASITVANGCFYQGNIKHFEMCAESTYVFGTDAFRSSTLEEVIIPDNSTVTLAQKSFAETTTIKYVYVGANAIASKSLGDDNVNTSVFGGNSYLSKIVLMDITYIGKWTLSTKKPGNTYEPLCDLYVYSHSEDFSFHNEAFNDRAGDYTVHIYTADPDMNSATASSNYVIYKGLGHAYEQGTITESTCAVQGTAGYATDCPCGIDYRENAYTIVDSAGNTTVCEALGTDFVYLPLSDVHIRGTVLADVCYDDYLANGFKYYYCSECNNATVAEETPTASPLFIAVGYSTFENNDGTYAISYSIKTNKEGMDLIKSLNKDLSYGLVAGVHINGSPVLGKNTSASGSVMADMTASNYHKMTIKIANLTNDSKSFNLNLCLYVVEGTDNPTVKYVSGTGTTDTAKAVSYESLLAERENKSEDSE